MLTIALIEAGKASPIDHPTGWEEAFKVYCEERTQARVNDAKERNVPWYFLNEDGLVRPTSLIRKHRKEPNNGDIETASWNLCVANDLMTELECRFPRCGLSNVTIELHAGPSCCHPLKEILDLFGLKVSVKVPE